MIKFFRKIRQQLLSENRFAKYLMYAVGEIVLVVIGILIALQLNMQREANKNTKLGYDFLAEMKEELLDDVIMLESFEYRLVNNLTEQESALGTKNLDGLPWDSVKMILTPVNLDIQVSELTFKKMTNLGLTALSKNDSLNAAISSYYNLDLVKFKRGIAYVFDHLKRYTVVLLDEESVDFDYGFNPNYEFPALYGASMEETKEEQRERAISFIRSIRGRKLVLRDLGGKRYSHMLLNRFQKSTEKLLRDIQSELESHDPNTEPLPTLPSETVFEEIELSTEVLLRFVGKYEGNNGDRLEVRIKDGQLRVGEEGLRFYSYLPYADKRFFGTQFYVQIEFKEQNGKVSGLTLFRNGSVDYVKVE